MRCRDIPGIVLIYFMWKPFMSDLNWIYFWLGPPIQVIQILSLFWSQMGIKDSSAHQNLQRAHQNSKFYMYLNGTFLGPFHGQEYPCCGYSLERPHSASFHGEIRKISIPFGWKKGLISSMKKTNEYSWESPRAGATPRYSLEAAWFGNLTEY